MLKSIRSFISELTQRREAKPHFSDDDYRLAAAALLVHIVSVDGVIDPAEQEKLTEVIQNAYDLSDRETRDLVALAHKRDLEAVDLYSFTSVLKRNLEESERLKIVEMMWEMVYADGSVHEFEDNTVWRVAELLAISARDRNRLKKAVREREHLEGTDEAEEGD